ncbi:high-affinity branched-chain amino acid ABC transporter permease LivM [Xanthobacter agilis]|uniref:Branched-chain amino acid transport system permease protein n=1 Tax=Xanthobacter agilis TaxID=47492 RepID=A0ABU0LCH2_XANAG|nr:high-affinity branched-chain amino acid ABC transporter permease LivM [Xanthobacter agilis]MDQ0504847.1 branched-chain amino acid transport system permease protein [Xanthobacter agilis]
MAPHRSDLWEREDTPPETTPAAPPVPPAPAADAVVLPAIKDAVASGVITGLLLLPLVGFRATESGSGPLTLTYRFGLVAVFALLVAGLRLVLNLTLWRPGRKIRDNRSAGLAALSAKVAPAARPAFFALALLYPLLAVTLSGGLSPSRYWVDLGIYILTYVMLGWGLNIVVGLAGLLDLGYVAFYAVGAYTFALLSTSVPLNAFFDAHVAEGFWASWSFFVCLPMAGILAALWGVILGFPVLRLRGDYLAIVTLAFGEIIRLVLINWVSLTNGGAGISSVPAITFFGVPFNGNDDGFAARFGLDYDSMHRMIFLYFIILGLAALTALVTIRLRKMPVGRAWEALREDEIACRSLGINTTLTKLTAFATGAMFGGFAGAFFAVRVRFVSPESFTFMESAVILAIVVLGGMGSQMGVAAAAILLIGGMEMLRNLSFLKASFLFGPDFDPSLYRMLIFGFAMVAVMVWRPRGLVANRMPTIFLKQRKAVSGALVKEGHG